MPSLSAALLAMMIALVPPGQSASSVVVEPSCGDVQGKLTCDLSPKPSWSPFYKGYVRPEAKDEALRRYVLIARAIEKTSLAMTTAPKRDDGTIEPAAWPGSTLDLAEALVTIAYHESSFRRDVHSGVGPYALGDCAYWDRQGRRVPASEARKLGAVGTSCQSVCLMQINTGGLEGASGSARFGFKGREMVGLDQASTDRCFAAGAKALAEARDRCARAEATGGAGAKEGAGWFARAIASYVTGDACDTDVDWVKARISTFDRVSKMSANALPKEILALLAADEGSPENKAPLTPENADSP